MSDSGAVTPTDAHQSAMEHLVASLEHLWGVIGHMAALTPGGGLGVSKMMAAAKGRLDSARSAIGDAGKAIADFQKGDVAAAEADVTSAGRDAELAVAGDMPMSGGVVSAGPQPDHS